MFDFQHELSCSPERSVCDFFFFFFYVCPRSFLCCWTGVWRWAENTRAAQVSLFPFFTCPPVELQRRHLISCLAYSLLLSPPHVCVIGDTHELRGSCRTVKQKPRVPALNETKKTVTFVLGKAEQWMDSLCISSTGVETCCTHKHTNILDTHANTVILRVWGIIQAKVTGSINAVTSAQIIVRRIITHFILMI